MNLLKFTGIRLDGEDSKVIHTGKVAIFKDHILGCYEMTDKFNDVIPNVVLIRDRMGGGFPVKANFDELVTELESTCSFD